MWVGVLSVLLMGGLTCINWLTGPVGEFVGCFTDGWVEMC